jgi:hypothetical protein
MHSEAPAGEGREGPSNIKQKREFKALVKAQNRGMEENFEEALSQAHYAYTHPSVPAEVQAILDDPCCTSPSPQSSAFWVAAQALVRPLVSMPRSFPLTRCDGSTIRHPFLPPPPPYPRDSCSWSLCAWVTLMTPTDHWRSGRSWAITGHCHSRGASRI